MDEEAPVHLQAMTGNFPACWRTRYVMTPLGPVEFFGPFLEPDEVVSFTPQMTHVTCKACRGLIQ